jgi:hypothetical protein
MTTAAAETVAQAGVAQTRIRCDLVSVSTCPSVAPMPQPRPSE